MSTRAFRNKAGLILTLVAFVLGVTAATAVGWENEQNNDRGHGKNEQNDDNDKRGDNKGGNKHDNKGGKNKGEQAPTVTVPQQPAAPVVQAPPAAAPAPAAGAPSSPTVTPQQQVGPRGGAGGGNQGGGGGEQQGAGNAPAQNVPGGQEVALAPAGEREQLAKTGIHPALIAFAGMLFLAGGAFMLRRALTR